MEMGRPHLQVHLIDGGIVPARQVVRIAVEVEVADAIQTTDRDSWRRPVVEDRAARTRKDSEGLTESRSIYIGVIEQEDIITPVTVQVAKTRRADAHCIGTGGQLP